MRAVLSKDPLCILYVLISEDKRQELSSKDPDVFFWFKKNIILDFLFKLFS